MCTAAVRTACSRSEFVYFSTGNNVYGNFHTSSNLTNELVSSAEDHERMTFLKTCGRCVRVLARATAVFAAAGVRADTDTQAGAARFRGKQAAAARVLAVPETIKDAADKPGEKWTDLLPGEKWNKPSAAVVNRFAPIRKGALQKLVHELSGKSAGESGTNEGAAAETGAAVEKYFALHTAAGSHAGLLDQSGTGTPSTPSHSSGVSGVTKALEHEFAFQKRVAKNVLKNGGHYRDLMAQAEDALHLDMNGGGSARTTPLDELQASVAGMDSSFRDSLSSILHGGDEIGGRQALKKAVQGSYGRRESKYGGVTTGEEADADPPLV